jgi:GTP-binding protein
MSSRTPEPDIEKAEISLIGPPDDGSSFTISRFEEGWRVEGRNIERIAAMTYWEFEATTRRFQQILDKMGISDALRKAGIAPGDTVFIGEEMLEWSD